MTADAIRFDDGGAYERYMGVWSQSVGASFLDWLAPAPGARWLDVGCGNGAFTELIVARCAPSAVDGIDPSEEQIAYARARFDPAVARFRRGDAMSLPYADASFDVAVMPLVIFFVPEPAAGVAEMTRVVRAGGWVSAYAWDMTGGGFPYAPVQGVLRELGVELPVAPSPEASRADVLHALWTAAGLEAVETCELATERAFERFDDFWATLLGGPSMGARIAALDGAQVAEVQARLRERLPADAAGHLTLRARANAVRGRVAGVSTTDT